MNEQQQQQLQALLGQAGLGDMSKYFTGDVGSLISTFGFTDPKQQEQFKQFFQGFDPTKYLQAGQEVTKRFDEKTSMLGERLEEQLGSLKTKGQAGFSAARGKARDIYGKSGFGGFGAAEKQQEMSLRDILEQSATQQSGYERQYQSGLLGAEKERGAGQGAVYAALQSYLNRLFGRAETIYGLDPTGGGNQYTPGDPGGGTDMYGINRNTYTDPTKKTYINPISGGTQY